jgi:hypothetical protein
MFSIHNYKHYENTNWFKMQNINRHRYPLCCFLPVRQLHKGFNGEHHWHGR